MAGEIPILTDSYVAAADLSADQFKFLKINSSGQVALASVAGEFIIGVLQNKPTLGQVAEVMIYGRTKVVAGGAIANGSVIATNALGLAKVASAANVDATSGSTTEPVKGSHVAGLARDSAAGANEIISMTLLHAGAIPGTSE